MLTEDDIEFELKQHEAFTRAYRMGKRGADLPSLQRPQNEPSTVTWLTGSILHAALALDIGLAQLIRAHRLTCMLCGIRLWTDRLSLMPECGGLNVAYTNLGLARLARGDVVGAVHCLDASWRIHPCPLSCSYGLRKILARALLPYPEAAPVIRNYVRIGRKFKGDRHWGDDLEGQLPRNEPD